MFDDIEKNQEFLTDLKDLYSKIEYVSITNKEFHNEADTFNFMLKKALEYDNNTPMLYIHTKGVSHTNPILKKNINAWVRYLDLYVIKQWERCLEGLKDNDAAGGFYVGGSSAHFQGNFFWANSNYIKGLSRINNLNIQNAENSSVKVFDLLGRVVLLENNISLNQYF